MGKRELLKNGKVWTWIYEHPKTFLLIMALLVTMLSLTMGLTFEYIAPPRPSTDATMHVLETLTTKHSATLDAIATKVSQ